MKPILKINLSVYKSKKYHISEEEEKNSLGDALLVLRLLYRYLTKKPNPFSPDASSLFINGPPTGISGLTVGQFIVCGKGPAIGPWEESNCGSL
jgi:aldehyde:ferredoxin oxidoreductase